MIHNKNILKIKLYFSDLLIIFFTIFLCFYVLIAPNKVAAAYALRVYVEPFIIYFVAKNSFFNTKQIKSMTRIVFASAVITSIYGIYQALVLGPSFLMKIGYPVRSNGRLDTSFYLSGFSNFQRVASTFASPNLFAFFASIVLIIVFIYRNAFRSKLRYQIGISIICIAILLTFSRSSILALVIAFIFISIQMKAKYTKQLIGILIALVIGTSIISDFTDIGLSAKLAKYIENTITLNDTSAVSHISSYYESFEIAKNNLLGTGLGRNGPKASQYFYDPILTESSYLLILFDTGVLGFLIYFGIYLGIYIKQGKLAKSTENLLIKDISLISRSLIVFMAFSFIFLPYVQDTVLMIYLLFFVGLGENRYIKEDFNM